MGNRERRKQQVLACFIKAAQEIIAKEGIDAVTIRKVADIAGFNSATLYNYFDDLDHLLLYASLNYLTQYNKEILNTDYHNLNSEETFYATWKSFSYISFQYPEAFMQIFFNKHSDALPSICQKYYTLFPEETVQDTSEWYPILTDFSLQTRNYALLVKVAEEERFHPDDMALVNEMMIASYHLLLEQCIHDKRRDSVDFFTQKMLLYIHYLIYSLKGR